MDIILNELKKIFNIKSVILLVLINIVMYFLFIEFEITYFPNGRPALNIYNMFVEMESSYGEFMDEEEFEDFKLKYEEAIKEADEYIQSREDFKRAGINSYEDFANMDHENEDLYELYRDVVFKKKIDVFWELPWREEYISYYKNKEELMMAQAKNEKQELRIKEILEKDLETSVFNDVIFYNYNELIKSVAKTILLSVMFLITPIYLRDNKDKVNYLQYTSKTGRSIFKKKIIAGLLASFILVTLQFICFFIMYSTNNTSMFFNCNINSIYNTITSWYDLTFIQYIALTVIGTYILAFVFTLIPMLVSSISKNYITAIAIQLPIALFAFTILLRYLIHYMTNIWYSKYFTGILYMILIFISTISIIIRWKREKKADILY
ncbi:hypothetical protein DW1_0526 [Proteiniborus sp. DW1]|uniref:hypothetical protein n=1 Tax=Proteiniborus sp. DW1 TaxID=1889883 RepID=UPI00092DEE30|nr:hypothetical protein [Proteiniborus sp. DW1]SCG82137.1 hypothetical protein DW1_0526 [Proteiniborus sp. DW1]